MSHLKLNRIKTSSKDSKEAIVIVINDQKLLIAPDDLTNKFDVVKKIKAELDKKVGAGRLVFIHKNRDGSIAIATGAPPDIWPEDELLQEEPVKRG